VLSSAIVNAADPDSIAGCRIFSKTASTTAAMLKIDRYGPSEDLLGLV
jgi:hypothetical protein